MSRVPPFRNAFVTGASSGLGRAIAASLAARGTRVVCAARRVERLESLAAEVQAAGGRVDVEPLDVADAAGVRASVERWDAELGGLDLVIANAGVGEADRADRIAWENVERMLTVNAIGAIATLHAALPGMLERGGGTLAGISSLAGLRGLPGSSAYSASKAALSTWLESTRIDVGKQGIRVVDVRPGFVKTEMTARNRFEMPFLLELEDGAARCLRGIERGKPIVTFPWPLASALWLGRRLPDALWAPLARAAEPKRRG